MSMEYFASALGAIHLVRLICLIVLVIFVEIRLPSCQSFLNEYLGFNHPSVLFYYILIWIAFAFEIYFLVNRLLASIRPQAKKSILVLYLLLAVAFILAAGFTLYAIIYSTVGYMITQYDFSDLVDGIIPLLPDCNILRLIGIILGFLISLLYLIAVILLCRL